MNVSTVGWVVGAIFAVGPSDSGPLGLSLAEAVELALAQNFGLLQARVDVLRAEQDIRQAWADLYPRVEANASYTRQFAQLNPFAGSDAASLFFGGASADQFLLFNEVRDAQGDPELDFVEFQNRFNQQQQQAFSDAGVQLSAGDNPFFVQNQFRLGLSLTQILYDASSFAALKGIEPTRQAALKSLQDQARQVVQSVTQAYYGVLLAEARADVLRRSEERLKTEVEETRQRVEQGVVPQFNLLSAEVDLANTKTQRIQAENAARAQTQQLQIRLGLRQATAVVLQDELTAPELGSLLEPNLAEALATAEAERPDLEAARLLEKVADVEAKVQFGNLIPRLEAFLDVSFQGQVPDDRTSVFQEQLEPPFDSTGTLQNPDYDPTAFGSQTRGFFDSSFWGPNVSGGIRLSWTIFDGFAQYAQLDRLRLEVQRRRFQRWELRSNVRAQVEQQVFDLQTAAQQLDAQTKNVERAELNYDHASARVREGVSSPVELRDANEQLDQSRLNRLQAVHDYRVAEVSYLVAIGTPPFMPDTLSTEIPSRRSESRDSR